jgi:catechol 2,3-dioxygenase-like lactoylglutathione lyase family enzyme
VARLDHLALTVGNLAAVRDWYSSVLSLEVEFESGKVAGLKDEGDVTLSLTEDGGPASKRNLYLQVVDVDDAYKDMLARGVTFRYPRSSE